MASWGELGLGPLAKHSGWDFKHHRVFFNYRSDDGSEALCYPAPENFDENKVWQGIPKDLRSHENILAKNCLACVRNRRLGVATFQTQAALEIEVDGWFVSKCTTTGVPYTMDSTLSRPAWVSEPILATAWADPEVKAKLSPRRSRRWDESSDEDDDIAGRDRRGAAASTDGRELLCPVSALARMFKHSASVNLGDILRILPLLDRHRWGGLGGDDAERLADLAPAAARAVRELKYYAGVTEETARAYVRIVGVPLGDAEESVGPSGGPDEGQQGKQVVDLSGLPAHVASELALMLKKARGAARRGTSSDDKWALDEFDQMLDHYFVEGGRVDHSFAVD